MYNTTDTTPEEADELRSLSTMDTLTFRRLREGRRKKSKESDDDASASGIGGSKKSKPSIRRRANDDASMGDTLTTLTNGSSRWSRRGSGSRGRNSRGEATRSYTGRRCVIDVCLLVVLGVVLIARFGSVEFKLQDNLARLRGGGVSDEPITDGAAYAQWLDRQDRITRYEVGEDGVVADGSYKTGRVNNDHDAAEEFFEQAIHNLKNGLPYVQLNMSNVEGAQEISRDQLQSDSQLGQELNSNTQLSGLHSQYDAQPDTQSEPNTQQQDKTQRAPEFQSFEQAQIQHQLQQAIIQQQVQSLSGLNSSNILDTQRQNLNQLNAEAEDHGEEGFKLGLQNGLEYDGAIMAHSFVDGNQGQQLAVGGMADVGVGEVDALASVDGVQQAIPSRQLQITTWNIAAINNNPFEYWITYDENPGYENIMTAIEEFLENPGEKDVAVSDVFTEEMFNQLEKRMEGVGWDNIRSFWEGDFRDRKIVTGFMKDPLLGSKRLASMPDRISNTINVVGSDEPVCRPTVINMYDGDLSTLELWWSAWEKFMFDTPLSIASNGEVKTDPVYKMLQPIKKAKYPDITEEEEKVSLPLQTLCGAIFDAILVHMMNTVSKPEVWQPLKKTMVENLNKNKVPRTLDILEKVYGTSDIITLQEVSVAFIDQAKSRALGEHFWIVAPGDLDAVRDQNSVICLKKTTFPAGPSAEITSLVEGSFEAGVDVPIAKGDILAITATDLNNTPFVIASFHGDTNGLATKPVSSAIMKAMASNSLITTHKLIFGLDANTYENAKPGKQQDVMDWGMHYVSLGLTSCWGDIPIPSNYTTFNSRTYLQPQLNKACKKSDKRSNGDVNPKDFILFGQNDFKVNRTWKDNTGEQKYIEDMAFPTLQFPSDHGVLSTIIDPSMASQNELQNAMPVGLN